MSLQVCHFHSDEDVFGVAKGDDGGEEFLCSRTTGHPEAGPYRWVSTPPPPTSLLDSGLTGELGLKVELPAALGPFKGRWVEYGVVEHAYATRCPEDFALLVERYGHTAQYTKEERERLFKGSNYSASKFLARSLSELGQQGALLGRYGPSTGRWRYNAAVTWWAFPPEPDWDERLSWEAHGEGMSYVPKSVEP